MANFERTKQLMEKLKSGGSEITPADTLMGFIKLGTDLGNIWATAKQDKVKTKMDLAIKGLSLSAKDLTYTDYQKEAPEGFDGDLYDYNRNSFITALESVEDTLKTPYIKETYGDAIDLAIRSNQAALAYQDTMRGQRATNLAEMTELMDRYTAMAENDPLLVEADDYEEAKGIMQHLTDLRTHIEKQTGGEMISEHLVPLQKAQKEFQIIADLHQMDRNKEMDGIQASIEEAYSPLLEKWMEEKGIIATDTTAGEITLGLPEDDPKTPYVDESRIFVGVDNADYVKALASFDKIQLATIALEADKLVKKKAATGMEDFEVIRDWMESGTPEQSMYGLYVGHELFADPNEPNPYEGQLDQEILDRLPMDKLRDKKASGMYAPQFKAMQTDFIQMQKSMQSAIDARQKLYGKTMDDLDEDTGNKIRVMSSQLNKEIANYNKTNPEILTVPAFAAGTAQATTHEAKGFHVDVLQGILDADDAEEFMGNNAWNEESLLKDFKDASSIVKWSAMRKLVDKYIDANGQPMNQVLARQVWDVEGLGQAEGKERYDVFYATLKSFRELMLADPYGTIFTPATIGD